MPKHTKAKHLISTLTFACSLMRPHGGKGVETLARYIERMFPGETFRDKAGNIHLDRRNRDRTGRPIERTLFVAHIDTVHRKDGHNDFDTSEAGWLKARGDCLGADDAAGVAILCNLAKFGTPAYYVFTQGEERGGIGATFLAENMGNLLAQFDRAIAFDRRDVWSVITHQGWSGRCCSNEFAEALADRLNEAGLLYAPDDTGVYTDTAEFTFAIPECTNLSVGYYSEHTKQERLDLNHYVALAKAARKMDWESLPTVRNPQEVLERYTLKGVPANDFPPIGQAEVDKYLTWKYSDYDLEAIDCIELAMNGRQGPLKEMLAYRMGANDFDRSIARSTLSQRNFKSRLLKEALDMVDTQGAEIALDVLIEEIVGGFH